MQNTNIENNVISEEEVVERQFKVYGDGDWINNSIKSNYDDADIVVLPGGSDVDPSLYGHKPISSTLSNPILDKKEMDFMKQCVADNKFIVAICKAAQMATALVGGYLIQDVNKHHSNHNVCTSDGEIFSVNSSHHQMAMFYHLDPKVWKLFAWSRQLSNYHIIEGNNQLKFDIDWLDEEARFMEPEIFYFPDVKILGIQGHPEWSSFGERANEYVNKLILDLYEE